MKNKIKKDSFVVVSDFHSYDWPLEIIENNYLKRFEKIYILGDATDRGEDNNGSNGLNLLLKIKELSRRHIGRIIYIPGNHDEMLYNYATTNDYWAKNNIIRNKGEKTIKDIDNLKENDPDSYYSLIYWLENLPIQKEHYYDNQRYVLAHALFNERLFKKNQSFSLKDYEKNHIFYEDILWFRKKFDTPYEYYDKESLPRDDSIMIIGHTPKHLRKGKNLDLINSYGETIKVYCVDGGISYDGVMHKFDSNTRRVEPAINSIDGTPYEKETYNYEEVFKKHILETVKNADNLDEAINKLQKDLKTHVIENKINQENRKEMNNYIYELFLYYSTLNDNQDYKTVFNRIVSKIVFDYIIDCLIKKYNSKAMTIVQLKNAFDENNTKYISNKVGKAREFAEKISLSNLYKVFDESSYKTIREYINSEYGKTLIK